MHVHGIKPKYSMITKQKKGKQERRIGKLGIGSCLGLQVILVPTLALDTLSIPILFEGESGNESSL